MEKPSVAKSRRRHAWDDTRPMRAFSPSKMFAASGATAVTILVFVVVGWIHDARVTLVAFVIGFLIVFVLPLFAVFLWNIYKEPVHSLKREIRRILSSWQEGAFGYQPILSSYAKSVTRVLDGFYTDAGTHNEAERVFSRILADALDPTRSRFSWELSAELQRRESVSNSRDKTRLIAAFVRFWWACEMFWQAVSYAEKVITIGHSKALPHDHKIWRQQRGHMEERLQNSPHKNELLGNLTRSLDQLLEVSVSRGDAS